MASPAMFRRHKYKKRKLAVSNMEPLFEPLLQLDIGIQRIPGRRKSVEHKPSEVNFASTFLYDVILHIYIHVVKKMVYCTWLNTVVWWDFIM
jgi:hypothetical protein